MKLKELIEIRKKDNVGSFCKQSLNNKGISIF